MSLNILFLDQFNELAGAQQCLLDLLPAVLDRGWKATVAAPGKGALAERVVSLGANFHPLRFGPLTAGTKSLPDFLRFARQLPGLTRDIAGLPADLIYVNGPRLLPAVPGGRPVIFHCHSFLRQRYARFLLGRALHRTHATVIAACAFVLTPLRRFAGPAHVVYNGVALPRGGTKQGREPGAFRIGMIGRIAPQKGQAEFLRAARFLEDCRFVICGTPLFGDSRVLDEVRTLAADLPVEFSGWRQDVSPLLSSLDLLVVPSTVPEGAPRIILEAFAAGVPVLAADCGGIPELIEHNRSGFLIQSLEPNAMASQIRCLMAHPDLLATVAGRAQQDWNTRYTIAEYQRQIVSIIESVASLRR